MKLGHKDEACGAKRALDLCAEELILSERAQARYLEQLGEDDVQLADEVRSLLAAVRNSAGFLGRDSSER